ncbi:MAG TPA: hypothetical protein VGD43_16570, partial [Micromonospora sp.]
MAATKPAPSTPSPDKHTANWLKGIGVLVVTLGVVAACVATNLGDPDESTSVPPPTVTERQDTVTVL